MILRSLACVILNAKNSWNGPPEKYYKIILLKNISNNIWDKKIDLYRFEKWREIKKGNKTKKECATPNPSVFLLIFYISRQFELNS